MKFYRKGQIDGMKRRIIEGMILLGLGSALIYGICCRQNEEGRFVLQAHRGWSEMYPENTLTAFEEAGKCELYGGIETDVQETADGVLVLMHDTKLDRTTNATGKIKDYSFEEVRAFKIDAGNNIENYPNEKIPTLEEFLQICEKYQKIPYIEMKNMTDKGVEKLLDILDAGDWKGKCVLTTFQYENLERVRRITSDYPVQYMVSKEFKIEEVLLQLKPYDNVTFRPSAYIITEEMVELCNAAGIKVECYGLKPGDKETLHELKRIGVLGVTCNDWRGLE